MLLVKHWLQLHIDVRDLVLHHLSHPPDLGIELFLLRIESQGVDLLHEVFHFVIIHFLLKHELQIRALHLVFQHALHICESGPRLYVTRNLLHGLLDIVEISFVVKLLRQLVPYVR